MNRQEYSKSIEQNHRDVSHVLSHYAIRPESVRLISSRGGRSKWLIETGQRNFFLRQEQIRPSRMLFIAGAHWHLQQNGLPIARLIPTRNGGLCLAGGEFVYVLYEASEGVPVLYYDRDQLEEIMAFTGQFHQASKGYIPGEQSKKRTRTGKWQKLYRWKLQELEDHKKVALQDPDDAFSQLFLAHVDRMLERGYEALNELDTPELSEWTLETLRSGMFCQQDFTLARMTVKEEHMFLKDLHSVTIDLPARDLRILLNKVMRKLNVWDTELAIRMLRSYDQVHPLTPAQYRILWTDLKFPHLFCSMVHKYYLGQKQSWGDEKYLMNFRNVIAMEESKQPFLEQSETHILHLKEGTT
ncbi:CotS family spore coat protein [Sporolactobacillus vineae]|uniref:CotS family spore coat protein n=1 Tax=Sporolactobacillus vineae TaxID=444463 RepID=UPI00028A0A98|nr:CotS family spore coat protein [Sporolactobacillus vineae]